MTRRELIQQGSMAVLSFSLPNAVISFLNYNHMNDRKNYEVIIIGGSYAGLSAAMALGRSLRNVLIIDSGQPCNRQTPHAHNFITQDGEKPAAITAKAKQQVLQYDTIRMIRDVAVSGKKNSDGFSIVTRLNHEFSARKLIFATGVKDTLPDIKGFAACWGISVVHCPYCHGYELRNKKTGIISNPDRAMHLASLLRKLTNDITMLKSGTTDFAEPEKSKLHQHNISIIETGIAEIVHTQGQVSKVIFKDGNQVAFDALYAAIPFTQHSDIPVVLGCQVTEQGLIKVDPFQKTSVPGIYACGDNSSMLRSIASAVYSGQLAGGMVNKELADEAF